MTAATVEIFHDGVSAYPYRVHCSECGTLNYRSTNNLAKAQAKEHMTCSACATYVDGTWVNGHCLEHCPTCYGHCDSDECYSCGETHCDEWCDDCQTHGWCDYCGDHCAHHHPDCEDCHESYSDDYNVEHYGYRPDPIFHGQGKLFVGLELEVTWPDADDANQWLDDYVRGSDLLYAKDDSSVSRGFELVTHPMSTQWALSRFPFGAIEDAVRRGAEPDNESCGTHMHMSRAGLSGRQWWTLFAIHRKLPELCGHVGGRGTTSEWARWDQADVLDYPIPAKHKKLSEAGVYAQRYAPVNVLPEDTIELRYPKGDFTPRGIRRNLQWAEALTTFGNDRSCHDLTVTDGALIEHINQHNWPELKAAVASY